MHSFLRRIQFTKHVKYAPSGKKQKYSFDSFSLLDCLINSDAKIEEWQHTQDQWVFLQFSIVNEEALLMSSVIRWWTFIWWLECGSLPWLFILTLNERLLPTKYAWKSAFYCYWQLSYFKLHKNCLEFILLHKHTVQILSSSVFCLGMFYNFFFLCSFKTLDFHSFSIFYFTFGVAIYLSWYRFSRNSHMYLEDILLLKSYLVIGFMRSSGPYMTRLTVLSAVILLVPG